MAQGVDRPTSLWIRRFNPVDDPNVRLVCLAHAGGSASFFVSTSRHLLPDCEVLAVQYPGRQDRRHEKPLEDVAELADTIAQQLVVWNDRPLAIFGHSLGAVVGYEVTHRLTELGSPPSALIVSGRRAPSRYREESVHLLNDRDLIAEVESLGGTNPLALADYEMAQMIIPALRSDYKAVESYRHIERSAFHTPIYAHVGLDDPQVSISEAEDWRNHTSGQFKLYKYRGGHFYLNAEGAALTANIRRNIVSAQSTPDPPLGGVPIQVSRFQPDI